jgi:hypothetical protein
MIVVALVRAVLGHAECLAVRHDRDSVHGIGTRGKARQDRMAALVVSHQTALIEADETGLTRAEQDRVERFLEVFLCHNVAILAGSAKCRFVRQIGEVRSRESRCGARENAEVHIISLLSCTELARPT